MIAGAGSGKTTLMAARVVYLVVTGQVRPDQVLGLTFTTKAASELRHRIRDALAAAGCARGGGRPRTRRRRTSSSRRSRPTTPTPPALLTDHGLRIGHEPDTRVITDAAATSSAPGRSTAFTGDGPATSPTTRATAIQNLLALDGAMSEHLVAPAEVRALDADARVQFERALAEEVAEQGRKTYRERIEKAIFAIDRRAELLGLVEAYRRLKRAPRADGLLRPDRARRPARRASSPRSALLERAQFRVVLLDEYQDTSVAQALMLCRAVRRRPPGHRGRRPQPGDLRLARGVGLQHPQLRRRPSRRPTRPGARRTRSPSTAAPTQRILEVANRLAAPLYAEYGQVAPLVAKPEAEVGSVHDRVSRRTPTSSTGWSTRGRDSASAHRGPRGPRSAS